jgi:hypothetical protein
MKEGFYALPPNPIGGLIHVHDGSELDLQLLKNDESFVIIGTTKYNIVGQCSRDLRSEEHAVGSISIAWNYPVTLDEL